jgi:hypothetical protein
VHSTIPEVQALVGQIERPPRHHLWRNPQADVRFVDLEIATARQRFASRSATASGQTHLRIEGLELPMPGATTLNATAAIAVARSARHAGRGDPQGAGKGFGGVKRRFTRPANGTASPSSTTTATIPVEIGGAAGGARVHQGRCHRRRAAAPLHAPATICSTSSPPASTMPTRSSSRRSTRPASTRSRASREELVNASAPAAIATRATSTGPERSRR